MVIIMVIIVGKVVAGDLVAIQYEGRLEGEDGEIFHATELRQPFVFVVRRILTNLVVVLTKQNQVSPGAALTGLVAGTFNMLATMTICSPFCSTQSCPFLYSPNPVVAGVQGMCKGEVRSLHLPANLAWGEMAPSPLPANCSVQYKVELTTTTSLQ